MLTPVVRENKSTKLINKFTIRHLVPKLINKELNSWMINDHGTLEYFHKPCPPAVKSKQNVLIWRQERRGPGFGGIFLYVWPGCTQVPLLVWSSKHGSQKSARLQRFVGTLLGYRQASNVFWDNSEVSTWDWHARPKCQRTEKEVCLVFGTSIFSN